MSGLLRRPRFELAAHGPAVHARKVRDGRRRETVGPADLGKLQPALAVEAPDLRQRCVVERHGERRGLSDCREDGSRRLQWPAAQMSDYAETVADERHAVKTKYF